METDQLRSRALDYHSRTPAGKIAVVPTKPHSTPDDLALAYSPGVAAASAAIAEHPDQVGRYTDRRNLVGVVTNGTAVLGMGNIGALAAKPVMEGKSMLFKIFADIDAFDLELTATDVESFVETVVNLAPTFGGINLEDIRAPDCFAIEEQLRERLDIPVMHDDQHGTAIVSSAALINSLLITGKKIGQIRVVVNGAGAAAVAGAKLYVSLGVDPDNMVMFDSRGAITIGRTDLTDLKRGFASKRSYDSLAEAMRGADLFLGLSVAGVVTADMVRSMNRDPVIFALANPDPEIAYCDAVTARNDVIVATGRSDCPNQVNNVLGFPYIFRGALDCDACCINEPMKIAAARALARLAREPVPQSIRELYDAPDLRFGRNYLLPRPFDHRLLVTIASAVARAAADSGVARQPVADYGRYERHLASLLPPERVRSGSL